MNEENQTPGELDTDNPNLKRGVREEIYHPNGIDNTTLSSRLDAQDDALRQIYAQQEEILNIMNAQAHKAKRRRMIGIVVNILIWIVIPMILVSQIMKSIPQLMNMMDPAAALGISDGGTHIDAQMKDDLTKQLKGILNF